MEIGNIYFALNFLNRIFFYSTMASKVTCPNCNKTIKCECQHRFQQHLIYCNELRNKFNEHPINNNNYDSHLN